MKPIAVTAVVAVALLGATPLAQAGQRPRPTDVPAAQVATLLVPNEFQVYNDYATAAQRYESRRVAVHYVTAGIDAPPLNDDDSDGIPDYV